VLVAAAGVPDVTPGSPLDPDGFTRIMLKQARRLGPPKHQYGGTEERYLLASAQFQFPEERRLTSDLESNSRKVKALRNTEGKSLVASGGLCAPATNIYSIPQFSVTSRPVRDALPSFNADRGAVNVPVPTTLASAANAITIITEANDALGGTFATKSCLDQTCLEYVETAVTIISHCREYGNLNARSWPESVTFENELTMAEHARIAEGYLLDRIKAQSINVTSADVYSTTHDLIYAITRTASSIRYILRTGENVRLRALLPAWVPDMMVADIAATQFDRFKSRAAVTAILREAGIEPTFYLDTPSTGTTQGFADEAAGAIDDFPDVIQFAVYVEGAFIHVDGGSLELGLVRDSTLNSTNDFQMFGETFENVALLAPAQAARWITATVCPSGEFPALTTALSC
jgi:NAD(P)-dependent dehydrogenase (short-subunit alcohol dehydrogenase family)